MAETSEGGAIMPVGAAPSHAQGDVPETVRRRYLTEGAGARLAYYTDHTAKQPAFHDTGRRLSTERADPVVIKDLLAIAEHRFWERIQVRGSAEFRREVWFEARLLGLEVDGYRPTGRDQQSLDRLLAGPAREVPSRPQAARSNPDSRREVTGELIDSGVAAYKYRQGAQRSPFIKLKLESGRVQTVWGVGLPAALKEAGVQIGEPITVRRTGVEQITRTVVQTDRETGELYREDKKAPRNQWEVVAARFRDATPEQAARDPELRGAQSRMNTVETVVRSRAAPAVAERIIGAARERIAGWLERGARFEEPKRLERAERRIAPSPRERQR